MTRFLFHYTDPESLEDILNDGVLRQTPAGGKHAHHGRGVYLTALGPRTNRQRLIFNNYLVEEGDPDKCPWLWEKTSAYIRIPISHLPNVMRVDDDPDKRSIYVYRKNIKIKPSFQTGYLDDDDSDY